jgi:hypothetical protein
MQMELLFNAPIPDGLLASMTLLSEKPRLGVPSRKSAPHQRIDERNCTAVLGLRFPCSEIVSGTVVAPNNTIQILQCASKTANQFSIAGVLGINEETHPVGAAISNAFLGNTFSGISDTITHVATGNFGAAYGDFALGGTAQGLPIGTVPASKGIVGVATEAGVNAVTQPGAVLSIAGTATELGEEGLAGPVGLAKLGIDLATYLGSAAYCANHF